MKLEEIKEADLSYSPISGATIPLDPGSYVVMRKETWDVLVKAIRSGEDIRTQISVVSMDLADTTTPSPCEECGAYFIHDMRCSNG